FEAGEIIRLCGQSAAAGNDRAVRMRKLGNDLFLDLAKRFFSSLSENVRDRPARSRLDQFVRVDKIEMQLGSDQPAYGGFAGAHKTDQRDVFNVPRGRHGRK